MAERWVTELVHPPRRCFFTGTSGAEGGPYYLFDKVIINAYHPEFNPTGNDQVQQLAISKSKVWTMVAADETVKILDRSEWERLNEQNQILAEQNHELMARCAQLEDELAARDEETELAEQIADALDRRGLRVQGKPGPKKESS